MNDSPWFAASDTATVRVVLAGDAATVPAHVLTPEQLRTVPMPNLRTADGRTLDAEARDLRTAGDKLAELTRDMRRLSETVQLMAVPLDVAMRLDDLAARVDMLAARVDMLAARPLAMAEDAWGVG